MRAKKNMNNSDTSVGAERQSNLAVWAEDFRSSILPYIVGRGAVIAIISGLAYMGAQSVEGADDRVVPNVPVQVEAQTYDAEKDLYRLIVEQCIRDIRLVESGHPVADNESSVDPAVGKIGENCFTQRVSVRAEEYIPVSVGDMTHFIGPSA